MKLKEFIKEPKNILIKLLKHTSFLYSDKCYLQMQYYLLMGKKLDLQNPKTFNEKIQWLKLYDRNPEYIKMVDKIAVKDYVKEKLGEEVVIPTIGTWDRAEDIDFDALPNQFVLKTNHSGGSLGVVICKDKAALDIAKARKRLNHSLKINLYPSTKEWPYDGVKPQILAEKYVGDTSSQLEEYKFWCFNGKVEIVFICEGRFSKEGVHFNFYDKKWNRLPFAQGGSTNDHVREVPPMYEKMIEYAEKLAENIPFVRIDLYNDGKQIFFGEITLYDSSGFGKFDPPEWDYKIGEKLKLPNRLS